jgi:hypothetical protein
LPPIDVPTVVRNHLPGRLLGGAVVCAAALVVTGCGGPHEVVASARSPEIPGAAAGSAAEAVAAPKDAPSTSANATPAAAVSSPVAPPSSALPTPLTVLEVGDSLGEDLGFGLGDVLRDADGVELVQAAKGNSGLVQPQYYDWPKHLSQLVAQRDPDVVVVFIGANDVQDFYVDGVLQEFGTPGWEHAYAQRVATMMQEATDAGAKVLWVGMPIMKSATFSSSMQKLNAIYEAQAALHPGVTYFSSWELFTDDAGRYAPSRVVDGKTVELRTPDGIHITFGNGGRGADVLAAAVVDAIPQALAT